ncbi:ORF67 [black bullhead herpesvirus]|uniref:ORF67 n=1 Tax=black bullhead herpesvirus TaxID=508441 RepID=A0A2H5AJI3_9VIRU|nr:ORF67 [black bullhead herpesvirus]AUG72316.1 ORF67 [black bullhead herpesvirus]
MGSIIYDSDYSDDEVSKVTLDNLLYTDRRLINPRRLLRNFGSLTNVADQITLSVPSLEGTTKPWLIFPVEKMELWEELITVTNTAVRDRVDQWGWIHETTCATQLQLQEVTPVDLGIVDLISRSSVVDRTEVLFLLVTDPMDGWAFKRLVCQADETTRGAKLVRKALTAAPVIHYDDVHSLFHLVATLPRDVYLDCTNMTLDDLGVLCGLHMGCIGDWRYTPRKILVTEPQFLTVNLTLLKTWDSTALLPVEPGLLQRVRFNPPRPHLRYKDDCMSAIKRSAAGVVIHGEPETIFSFTENRIETLDHCTITDLNPEPPMMMLLENRTRKIIHISAALGSLTVEAGGDEPHGEDPQYSEEYVTITCDRDLRGYMCISAPAWHRITVGGLSRNGVLHLLHHMEVLSHMGLEQFRIVFQEGVRELTNLVEAFVSAIPETNAPPLHLRVIISRRHMKFRLWDSIRHVKFQLKTDPWDFSQRPEDSNVLLRRPRQGTSKPRTKPPKPIPYNWVAMIRVDVDEGFMVPIDELPDGVIRAMCISHNLMDDLLYIPTPPGREDLGDQLLNLPLATTGFAYQWAPTPRVETDGVGVGSRRAVITLHKLDYLDDAHVAVICANEFLGTTACGEALHVTPDELTPGPHRIELSVKPTSNPDQRLQQLTHRRNGFCSAYYDEAITLGWFLGLLSGERMSIKDPSSCLMSFYSKLHPNFLQHTETGTCFVAHTFRRCSTDLMGCLTATSYMIQLTDNVIVVARNPASGTQDVRFSIDAVNGAIIRALFQTRNWAERYAQLFGPVFMMRSTGHTVSFNGVDREVVRMEKIYPDTRTPGVQLVITVNGANLVVVPLGFAPLLMIDDDVAWYDLTAPGILVTSTTNNWGVTSESTQKLIEKPSYGMNYRCYRVESREGGLPSYPHGNKFWCNGPRDIFSDPIFDHLIQRTADGYTVLRNVIGSIDIFHEIPAPVTSGATYQITDRGYVPARATAALTPGDAPLCDQLRELTPTTEIMFRTPKPNWYTENTLVVGTGAIIKWLSVVMTRGVKDPPLTHQGVKIIVTGNPIGLLSDTELCPGIFVRHQVPWAHCLIVTDYRLLFGVLLLTTKLYDYIHITVDAHGVKDMALKMVMEQATIFTKPKRIIITDLDPEDLTGTIFLGELDARNIRIYLDGPADWRQFVRDTNTRTMNYVTGDDFDVRVTSAEFHYRATDQNVGIEPFMLRDLEQFIVSKAPANALPIYRDPYNPQGSLTEPFWFDVEPDPINILTRPGAPIYTTRMGSMAEIVNRSETILPRYTEWGPERLQMEPDPEGFLSPGDVLINTLVRTPREKPAVSLKLTLKNTTLITIQHREIMKIRMIDPGDEVKYGVPVTRYGSRHGDDVIVTVNGTTRGYYSGIWGFHGLGGEEPCLEVATGADSIAVAGAIRLFLATITQPLTFTCVNIILPHNLRPGFVRHMARPLVFDRRLYSVVIDRLILSNDKVQPPTQQPTINETREIRDEWSKRLYFLKQRLTTSGLHRDYWIRRFTTRESKSGNRWLGAAWLSLPSFQVQRLLSRENFIRDGHGRSTPRGP